MRKKVGLDLIINKNILQILVLLDLTCGTLHLKGQKRKIFNNRTHLVSWL